MMAGEIEHRDLPDNLCHEPKGASTAANGTVYVADGNASGSFKLLPLSSLDTTYEEVNTLPTDVITSPVSVTDGGLSQTATGVLTDVAAHTEIPQDITLKINMTSAELLRFYNNQKTINDEVSAAITSIESKLNELLTALKSEGFIE